MNETAQDNQKTGQKQNAKTPAAPEKPGAVRGKPRQVLTGLLITVALVSAASALYLAYRGRSAGISTHATLETLVETSAALDARLGELETRIEQLQEAQEAASRTLLDFSSTLPGSNEDWALAEIEFLLIIATHHAQLEHDPGAALAAMQTAELRLRGMDNTALEPVREQLARDIDRLQEVSIPDIKGLALMLADLADRADRLPLAGTGSAADKPAQAAVTEEQESAPQGFLKILWQELQGLVVIRHDAGGQPALLLPGQEYFVYQNLRLELESARLSLLRRDTENLHTSVSILLQWLGKYFDKDQRAVIDARESLRPLSSINLDPPLPDISSSLESLRAYMREKAAMSRQDEENGTPRT
ncbi:MAG: uroporphyrinogen-III C-methyltransferase [Gammaproteobacteria bacterium]